MNQKKLERISSELGELLKLKDFSFTCAESCTGGLISKRLTDVKGSSKYFMGSIIAYSNFLKPSTLNIPITLINQYGAVSGQVASKMSENIKEISGADIGIGITGISGPEGESSMQKPIGIVYISLHTPKKNIVKKYNFNYGRIIHREMASIAALNLIRLYI